MTANLLTLNFTKTEFLLICLKQQNQYVRTSSLLIAIWVSFLTNTFLSLTNYLLC